MDDPRDESFASRARNRESALALPGTEVSSWPRSMAAVVEILDKGRRPNTVPSYFAAKKVVPRFREAEGQSASWVDDGELAVLVLGPRVPSVGDRLVARLVGGRWVAERQGACNAGVQFYARDCANVPVGGAQVVVRQAGVVVATCVTTIPFGSAFGFCGLSLPIGDYAVEITKGSASWYGTLGVTECSVVQVYPRVANRRLYIRPRWLFGDCTGGDAEFTVSGPNGFTWGGTATLAQYDTSIEVPGATAYGEYTATVTAYGNKVVSASPATLSECGGDRTLQFPFPTTTDYLAPGFGWAGASYGVTAFTSLSVSVSGSTGTLVYRGGSCWSGDVAAPEGCLPTSIAFGAAGGLPPPGGGNPDGVLVVAFDLQGPGGCGYSGSCFSPGPFRFGYGLRLMSCDPAMWQWGDNEITASE